MKNTKAFTFVFTLLMLSITLEVSAESIRQTLNRQNAFRDRIEIDRMRREISDSIREQKRHRYESETRLREYENSERSKYFLNEPSTYNPINH